MPNLLYNPFDMVIMSVLNKWLFDANSSTSEQRQRHVVNVLPAPGSLAIGDCRLEPRMTAAAHTR